MVVAPCEGSTVRMETLMFSRQAARYRQASMTLAAQTRITLGPSLGASAFHDITLVTLALRPHVWKIQVALAKIYGQQTFVSGDANVAHPSLLLHVWLPRLWYAHCIHSSSWPTAQRAIPSSMEGHLWDLEPQLLVSVLAFENFCDYRSIDPHTRPVGSTRRAMEFRGVQVVRQV